MSIRQLDSLNLSIPDNHLLCQRYLHYLYLTIDLSLISKSDNTTTNETYGEILPASMNKLLNYLNLTTNDVFFDLGSGTGKVAAYTFLQSNAKKIVGIEINQRLHEQALIVAKKIRLDLPQFFDDNHQLNFLQGSFLEISLIDATVAFVNATCFSQKLINDLTQRLNQIVNLHTVLSVRPLSNLNFRFIKAIPIECSWDSALCYVYHKK